MSESLNYHSRLVLSEMQDRPELGNLATTIVTLTPRDTAAGVLREAMEPCLTGVYGLDLDQVQWQAFVDAEIDK